jgi:hypothetical protein
LQRSTTDRFQYKFNQEAASIARSGGREGMMKASMGIGLPLFLAALAAPAAYAQDPCVEDVKQFCPAIQPGSGRVNRCLKENEEKISVACRAKLDADDKKARALVESFTYDCTSDVGRFCSSVQPGGGRVLKCLSQHSADLSERCEAQLDRFAEAREKLLTIQKACKADTESLCGTGPLDATRLIACLQTNEAKLSPECKAEGPSVAFEAASLINAVDELTSEARISETLGVLQGLDSIAFSRNQISFVYDYFQGLAAKPINANVLTLTPLLVFGDRKQFAVQVKVPVVAFFPTEAGIATVSGVGDVNTAFAWAFYARGSVRQYAALNLQWNAASVQLIGAPWVIAPVYALVVGIGRIGALNLQLTWAKSFGNLGSYPGVNILQLRPIFVVNLPAQTFLALDTKLGWDFVKHIFVPVMRFQAGKLIGKERNVSIAAWYQLSLTTQGRADSFEFGVGATLSYFFDW